MSEKREDRAFDEILKSKLTGQMNFPEQRVWNKIQPAITRKLPFYKVWWGKSLIFAGMLAVSVAGWYLWSETDVLKAETYKHKTLSNMISEVRNAAGRDKENQQEAHEKSDQDREASENTFGYNRKQSKAAILKREYDSLLGEMEAYKDDTSGMPYALKENIIDVNLQCSEGVNLVPNPGFEAYDTNFVEKNKRAEGKYVLKLNEEGWQACASPDYYSRKYLNVPNNDYGAQYPRSGDAYIGLKMGDVKEREHIYFRLKEPLEEGKYYCVQFYVSRAKYSNATKDLGVYFSRERLNCNAIFQGNFFMDKIFYMTNSEEVLLDDTDWQTVSGIYKAKGGERYINFGLFINNKNLEIESTYDASSSTLLYYYLDDLSVVAINSPELPRLASTKNEANLDKFIINFNRGQFKLDEKAKFKLDYIARVLNARKDLKVEVYGHASETGGSSNNRVNNFKISKYRTNNTVRYLLEKGVDDRRIHFKALGDHFQTASNANEEEQKMNQRVEVIISNKQLPVL